MNPTRAPTRAQRLGAAGEAAALARLEAAGLRLLARNVRSRHGELDLVMREGATLVFVEVRTRASTRHGGALASVDAAKRRRLLCAAAEFLAQHRELAQCACRFDIVGYDGHEGAPAQWLRGAFEAD